MTTLLVFFPRPRNNDYDAQHKGGGVELENILDSLYLKKIVFVSIAFILIEPPSWMDSARWYWLASTHETRFFFRALIIFFKGLPNCKSTYAHKATVFWGTVFDARTRIIR